MLDYYISILIHSDQFHRRTVDGCFCFFIPYLLRLLWDIKISMTLFTFEEKQLKHGTRHLINNYDSRDKSSVCNSHCRLPQLVDC
jgi:hypothetical protein